MAEPKILADIKDYKTHKQDYMTHKQDYTTHKQDDVIHTTIEEVVAEIEQESFKTIRSGKDEHGVFTVVEHRRKSDNTLVRKSVLSGGVAPNYTTRTITYYAANGSMAVKTDTYTLSYDADGEFLSEV